MFICEEILTFKRFGFFLHLKDVPEFLLFSPFQWEFSFTSFTCLCESGTTAVSNPHKVVIGQ